MTKQVYDVVRKDETIDVYKNDEVIYSISVADKSINLQSLYLQMNIDLEDEILVKHDFVKIEEPKNDADRIYNNTIDFMNRLLGTINKKLKELRERRQDSIF